MLCLGRSGFGNVKPTPVPEEESQAHWKVVTKTRREIKEEHNLERTLQLQLQCHCVQWEGYIQNNFTWKTILPIPPSLLSFCLGTIYNIFPSTINLKRCRLALDSRCFLYHKDVCTIPYMLGACKISLQQDIFTFRYDGALQHLVLVLKSFLKDLPNNPTKKCNILKFVKFGIKFSKTNNISKKYSSPSFRLNSSC